MSNTIYDIQLQGRASNQSITATGGKVYVTLAGQARKATLLNPDAGFAALANPLTPVRGKVRFAIANQPGALVPPLVDIYGISPKGHFFTYYGTTPGNPTEISIDENLRQEVAIIPFSIADTIANTETDTGFDFPVGALVDPVPVINVRTLQASQTINVGLLSSQSGGNASGFAAGVSLAAAGPVKATNQGTATLGALLKTTPSGGSAGGEDALITTATRLTYTLSAGCTLPDGFIALAYQLTA